MSHTVNEDNPRVVPSYAPVSASDLPSKMPYGPVNGVEVYDHDEVTAEHKTVEDGLITEGDPSLGAFNQSSPFGFAGQPVDNENEEGIVPEGNPDSQSVKIEGDGANLTPEGANIASGANADDDGEFNDAFDELSDILELDELSDILELDDPKSEPSSESGESIGSSSDSQNHSEADESGVNEEASSSTSKATRKSRKSQKA